MPNFRICKIINDRVYDLQGTMSHFRCAALAVIQLCMHAECISSILPDASV